MSETSAASTPSAASSARGAAVTFIFVTILLDMLALGLIMPILPKLVESFVDNDTARAARIFGVFGTAWALMPPKPKALMPARRLTLVRSCSHGRASVAKKKQVSSSLRSACACSACSVGGRTR